MFKWIKAVAVALVVMVGWLMLWSLSNPVLAHLDLFWWLRR